MTTVSRLLWVETSKNWPGFPYFDGELKNTVGHVRYDN